MYEDKMDIHFFYLEGYPTYFALFSYIIWFLLIFFIYFLAGTRGRNAHYAVGGGYSHIYILTRLDFIYFFIYIYIHIYCKKNNNFDEIYCLMIITLLSQKQVKKIER